MDDVKLNLKKDKNMSFELVHKITSQAENISKEVYIVCKDILEDKRFRVWSASSNSNQHHYGQGGLIQHTSEVIDICLKIKELYAKKYEIDTIELFLSAFFHDIGKMWDYIPKKPENILDYDYEHIINAKYMDYPYDEWESTPHKRLIHHISRSGLVWSENAKKSQIIYKDYHDKVLHAILSHHTKREYGSPVAPKSRIAWILTLCDNLSARMYDADSWDILG